MYWFRPFGGQELTDTCNHGVIMRSVALREIRLSKEHRVAVLEKSRQLHDPANITYFTPVTMLLFWSLLAFAYFIFILFTTHPLTIVSYVYILLVRWQLEFQVL